MNIINTLLNTNFTPGREGHEIRNIVLHTLVGTISASDARFRNLDAKVSVHYGVGLNGDISRWVLETDTAWQTDNRPVNLQSIGIGHEDNANPDDSVRTDTMYNASAELVADLCKRYDIPCKLVEVDGNHMPVESGIVLHSQVSLSPTECPGDLDSNRIVQQAQVILEPPSPEEPKPVVYEALPAPKKLRVRDMANGGVELWDLTFRAWADVKSVEHLNAGDEFDAVAIAHHPLGGKYYVTAIDYNNSGQSDIPYRPQGANVDDLEDYPEEVSAPVTEPQPAAEPAPTSEVTSAPDSEEHVAEPEIDPQPATEPSVEDTSEVASSETTASEPTPPAPQITYSELGTPLDLVTNKAPTNVYALDTETFAKITSVKELAEGTPFKAVSEATVIDGSETTYYYVDDQSQAVKKDDLQEVPAHQEQTIPQEQIDSSESDPLPAPETDLEPEPDPRATQKPLGENEGPVMMDVLPPKSNPNKWMKSYEDFDEPFKMTPNGTYEIEDLQDPNHKEVLRQFTNDKPNVVNIVGHLYKDGQEYYLSEKCAHPVDAEGKLLPLDESGKQPRVWLGILPDYLEDDVDDLSNQAIELKTKEKVIAAAGTINGIVHRAFFKTKKGSGI
jgi:hypothetical protein